MSEKEVVISDIGIIEVSPTCIPPLFNDEPWHVSYAEVWDQPLLPRCRTVLLATEGYSLPARTRRTFEVLLL